MKLLSKTLVLSAKTHIVLYTIFAGQPKAQLTMANLRQLCACQAPSVESDLIAMSLPRASDLPW